MARIPAGSFARNRIFFNGSVLLIEDMVYGEATVGGEPLERNTRGRMTAEVLPRSPYRVAILPGQRFLVRLNRDFQELQDGRDLIGTELLNQFVDVLSRFKGANGHCVLRGCRVC
jgi:hypothetical protein